jgi:hypothetical protein
MMVGKPSTVAAIGCVFMATATWGTATAAAAASQEFARRSDERRAAGERYFIDFRSRPGHFLGHTFIVYGRLNAQGQPLTIRYAGMYPQEDPSTGLPLASVFPGPGSIQVVKEDLTQAPSNSYRRHLSAAEYARLDFAVRQLRATEHRWHLLFYNCNDFAIDIARRLGLHAPSSWLLPMDFVAILRALNER